MITRRLGRDTVKTVTRVPLVVRGSFESLLGFRLFPRYFVRVPPCPLRHLPPYSLVYLGPCGMGGKEMFGGGPQDGAKAPGEYFEF